jgi:hypothetical protein
MGWGHLFLFSTAEDLGAEARTTACRDCLDAGESGTLHCAVPFGFAQGPAPVGITELFLRLCGEDEVSRGSVVRTLYFWCNSGENHDREYVGEGNGAGD